MSLLMVSGLLLLTLVASPRYLGPAHAAGFPGGPGLVCLIDPSTAPAPPTNPCPATPYAFTGPFPSTPQIAPTQIRIGVYINGSNALNGFDITLKSNNTIVLVPADADSSGTLVPNPTSGGKCVNGLGTCSPTDVYGTVHVSLIGGLTTPPTTGLLFTSIWNIVGNSSSSGIGISFQTGCSSLTSVPGGVCVTISNGSTASVPETIQRRNTFVNPIPVSVPWIALTSTPNATTLTVSPNAAVSVLVTAVAENGWPGFSVDNVAFSSAITPGFTAPTFTASSCATGGTRCSTTATLNTGKVGFYVVYILGKYVSFDLAGTSLTDTLVGSIRFNVNVQVPFDFSIFNRAGRLGEDVTVVQGGGASNTIIVDLVSGTTQSVSLACTSGLPAGASCTFNPSSLLPTYANTFGINTMPSTPLGSYLITVTGVGGGQTHTTQFTLTVISPPAVGALVLPIDKLGLLASYLGLAAAVALTAGASIFLKRYRSRRNEK
jgi:hypothetical protein